MTQATFTPSDQQLINDILARLSLIERTLEVKTTGQIASDLAPTFAPVDHGNANHTPDFATKPHGNTEHSTNFADNPHGNGQHSTAFADNPHNNSQHSATFATTGDLTTAISGHDTEHDDRFSQLAHTHAYLPTSYLPTATGTYTGDGTAAAGGIQKTCGFVPRMVIILGGTSTGTLELFTTLTTVFAGRQDNGGNITYTTGAHIHATDGFVIGDGTALGANTNTKAYTWVAVR